ncbi:hypothetical protein PDIDSM_2458 [Penicillium digitatum]|nr:hypothetical protein PDIDSM_2686 [Penicillium digitatum]KAG0157779.1 hypothetical protein PDIDSM_2456 [Penicillium digitatum]KAG0157793.1 hypothetical protein PDIDSM_1826 [Penicillium digitatum]KAG0157797.1 hypothetical protein PDIDSM_2452 [Penicillium digitatum]KAG0157800.1 hypothetical protein PDIDSM_2458 [Penicillium digitatum]
MAKSSAVYPAAIMAVALRTHLRTHGVMVARNTSGRISQGGQDAAVAWFEALFPENEPHDGD